MVRDSKIPTALDRANNQGLVAEKINNISIKIWLKKVQVQAESNKSNLTPDTKPLKQPKRKKQNKQHNQRKWCKQANQQKQNHEHYSSILVAFSQKIIIVPQKIAIKILGLLSFACVRDYVTEWLPLL